MKRHAMLALATLTCCLAAPALAEDFAPGDRVEAYLGGLDWKSCTVLYRRIKQGSYEVRCDGDPDTRQVGDDADHMRRAPAGLRGPLDRTTTPGTTAPAQTRAPGLAVPPPTSPTNPKATQGYAPGDKVDAYLGGRDWQACSVVRRMVRQGAYEIRCDGKPDSSQVGDDVDHIRPATEATRASTARTNAEQAALRHSRPDIDANLRPVTLPPGGKPLSGIYLQLKPMMAHAALGRTSYDYFTFWPDGRLCEMLPIAGADPADYESMKRAKPRLCGRYVFASNRLTIDVPDNVKVFDYEIAHFDGTNFVMNGSATVKVGSFGDGTTLDRRYAGTHLFPTTFEVSLHLRSDGTFDLVETPRQGGPARHLQGRYRLYGNTLDLGSERHTIYPLEGGRPGRLVLDGDDLDPV